MFPNLRGTARKGRCIVTNQMQGNVVLQGFDGAGGAIKLSSPIEDVLNTFREAFNKEWAKRSVKLQTSEPIIVEGNFVRIDEGSRWMRYWLTFFAGHAVVEVEGHATMNGQRIADFHYVEKSGWGLFGGDSKSLVKLCAGGAARKMARAVTQEAMARGDR